MATLSTLATIIFYLLAQMVGAGALVTLLFANSGISYKVGVIGVGTLMILYVVFGGMLATTWVQIIKAIMLLTCAIAITLLVLAHFHFHPARTFLRRHAHGPPTIRPNPSKQFPATRHALPRLTRRTRSNLPKLRPNLRHSRPPAHPSKVLHRSRRSHRRKSP